MAIAMGLYKEYNIAINPDIKYVLSGMEIEKVLN